VAVLALREETPDADFEAFCAEHRDERDLRLKARHDD
jgi:hypothetical protein